jgi:hypothetical protein
MKTLTREVIATILEDNITFSGQVGDYVIHGAIEEIFKLIDEATTEAYEKGYNDATKEACAEIAKNYHPNQ